jgi:hypothetical protein
MGEEEGKEGKRKGRKEERKERGRRKEEGNRSGNRGKEREKRKKVGLPFKSPEEDFLPLEIGVGLDEEAAGLEVAGMALCTGALAAGLRGLGVAEAVGDLRGALGEEGAMGDLGASLFVEEAVRFGCQFCTWLG